RSVGGLWLPSHRHAQRHRGTRSRPQAPSRFDPDGHSAAGSFRARGDQVAQGGRRAQGYSGGRGDRLCDEGRRGAHPGSRLRGLFVEAYPCAPVHRNNPPLSRSRPEHSGPLAAASNSRLAVAPRQLCPARPRGKEGVPLSVSVTENSLPGWTRSWQGVRQFWPNEVFASAPGGSDSMASVSACGADFMKSRLRLGIVAEHAASMKPHAVTAMTRLMNHTTSAAWGPPIPRTRP